MVLFFQQVPSRFHAPSPSHICWVRVELTEALGELAVILPHKVSSIGLLEVQRRGRREGKWRELCQHTCTSFGLSWTISVLMMYNLQSLARRSLKTITDRLCIPLISNCLKQVITPSIPPPTPCCR